MLRLLSISSLIFFSFVTMLFCSLNLSAQQLDSLSKAVSKYGARTATSSLFVHFDKNIYTNNDQVWFTGYLLQGVSPIAEYHTLYLTFINNTDSTIVLQKKFIITDGMSFGDFNLPDSLPSGSYRFVVHTNIKVSGNQDPAFIQPVTVRSTTKDLLVPNISILKAQDGETKNGTVFIKTLTSDNRFVENAEIKYAIGKDKIIKNGVAKSNVIGEVKFDFPLEDLTDSNNLLQITIKKDNLIKRLKYPLPVINQKKYDLRFYPESGYLVDGLPCKVGVEINDFENAPARVKAVLYIDAQPVDTIQTNATGIGSFSITPSLNSSYSVKILDKGREQQQYKLPKILKNGIVINANDVIANKDFKLRLQTTHNAKVHVVVHNYNDIFLHSEIALKAGFIQNVKLDLDAVPLGLTTITLLDSNFMPLTERIFFSHYHQLNQLEISTDKNEYKQRDTVRLKLNALTYNRKPLSGLVSISCTQTNRFSMVNDLNIVDYSLLQRELTKIPINPMGLKITDGEYLNDILLVKGWRRYKWPSMADSLITTGKIINEEVTGIIKAGKKNIGLPMELFAIANTKVQTIVSDSTGNFVIPQAALLTEDKDKVWLSINHKNPFGYILKVTDPFDDIKKNAIKQAYDENVFKLPKQAEVFNVSDSRGINLKEVVIKTERSGTLNFSNAHTNRCGDFVCPSNILNCVNHFGDPRNKLPVKNAQYRNQQGGSSMYHGCEERVAGANIAIVNGIKLPKEFYKFNLENKEEPINFPTIYWNYQCVLTDQKETDLVFTTGDLTGNFKIVVQGITTNGPVYSEEYINVKRP